MEQLWSDIWGTKRTVGTCSVLMINRVLRIVNAPKAHTVLRYGFDFAKVEQGAGVKTYRVRDLADHTVFVETLRLTLRIRNPPLASRASNSGRQAARFYPRSAFPLDAGNGNRLSLGRGKNLQGQRPCRSYWIRREAALKSTNNEAKFFRQYLRIRVIENLQGS